MAYQFNMFSVDDAEMTQRDDAERIQTDDATCALNSGRLPTANLEVFQTDRMSASLKSSPIHGGGENRKIDYHRLDSGICENFSRMELAEEMHTTSRSGPIHQQNQSVVMSTAAQPSFVEFYDADADGDCYLHIAIASGYTKVVFALVGMAPHPSYLDIQNNELYAPLHIAVLMNQPQMVRRLVIAGATTDIRDKDGNTPLHLAAKRGYVKCAEALLSTIRTDEIREVGADTTAPPALFLMGGVVSTNLRSILDLKNYHGEHCVHLATFGQHYEFIRFLQCMDADLNAKEGRSGKTALHYAVNKRDVKMTEMLAFPRAAGGCGVLLNVRDWAGRSPYLCAKINGDHEIAGMLASLPACDTSADDEIDEDCRSDTDEETTIEMKSFSGGSHFLESKA